MTGPESSGPGMPDPAGPTPDAGATTGHPLSGPETSAQGAGAAIPGLAPPATAPDRMAAASGGTTGTSPDVPGAPEDPRLVAELLDARRTVTALQLQLQQLRTEHARQLSVLAAQHAASLTRIEQQLRAQHDDIVRRAGADAARSVAAGEALRSRLAAADREVVALRHQLGTLEGSSVWRASWPLRRSLDRMPAARRRVRRLMKGGWWLLSGQLSDRVRARRDAGAGGRVASPDGLPDADRSAPAASHESATPDAEAGGPRVEPPARDDGRLPETSPAAAAPAAPVAAAVPVLPTSGTPVVSVIVPSFGQVPVTLRCLRALAASDTRVPFEVIVAEDASGDPEVERLRDVPGLRLVRNERNLGFLHNCNEAALLARGRFLLFLNNDTEPMPGSIDALHSLLAGRPDAGLVGAKLVFPDGRLQEAGGIIWRDGTGWNFGRDDDPDRSQYSYVREVDYLSGAAIMLSRELFERLGGFDPAFAPAYYEDADLAFRVRALGLKVLLQPAARVIHHEGMSHGTDPAAGVKRHQELNRQTMLARWPLALSSGHFPPLIATPVPASLSRDMWSQEVLGHGFSGPGSLRAPDRGVGRRTILLVDHYVPEPDRDAGSRSVMAIVDALLEQNWIVKFWPQNRHPSPYGTFLEARGVEVMDWRNGQSFPGWIARHGADLDRVLLIRPEVAADFVGPLCRHSAAPICFYGVDIHHRRMERQAALDGDAALLAAAAAMRVLEHRLWRLCDVLIYPSEEEAALVREAVPGARAHAIVPFRVDGARVRSVPPDRPTVLFVAGFAHPPNIDAARWLVHDILPLLRAGIPEVRLVLAGSHPSPAVLALASDVVSVTGSLDEEALGAAYAEASVAVVPLRAGAGVKGKVVEALAHGLPLVTTPIGAEGIPGLDAVVPVEREAGAIAGALLRLLRDPDAWRRQSEAQARFAAERFSPDAVSRSVAAALAR
ncbi:glycosyltransferase [Rhizosaccharibacter radicis]|uniref:Glycosyltransferase n=1 Tax=Rhizosaccharibacter radicis TaxID=2782605 RepID=A0ABT1VSW3_9PROT|nr:glycosyltransferase [Acetobacteraceae bacterium KSS12]